MRTSLDQLLFNCSRLKWVFKVTIFVTLLFVSPAYGNIQSPTLCARLLKSLADEKLTQKSGNVRVDRIIALLKELAKSEADKVGEIGTYEALVKVLEDNDQTIHATDSTRHYDDTRVLLDLPKRGEATVWELLNPDEREWLALQLEHTLKEGQYDYELVGRSPGHTDLWYALQRIVRNPESMPNRSGIVPRLALNRCFQGGIMGVCRHSTVVLAGLLGELGIPTNQIRLVSGSKGPTAQSRHIWVEIQLVRGATQWVILDPTSRSRLSNGEIRGGSSNRNRNQYNYDVRETRDFLIPKQSLPAPAPQ